MLGAFGGLFLVLLFFSSRSNFDDKYQHEMSSTLWGPAGSCSSYFKRLRRCSASHYMVTGEGWKTESKQVVSGREILLRMLFSLCWSTAMGTLYFKTRSFSWTPRLTNPDSSAGRANLKDRLYDQKLTQCFTSPYTVTKMHVWIWICKHGLWSCNQDLLQLQKFYLPIHVKWIYSCWFK